MAKTTPPTMPKSCLHRKPKGLRTSSRKKHLRQYSRRVRKSTTDLNHLRAVRGLEGLPWGPVTTTGGECSVQYGGVSVREIHYRSRNDNPI